MRFVALWLSGICIAVFGLQTIFTTEPFLLINSLKFAEPWRILTAVFAHNDIGHLLSNLIALCLFGLILEGRIGSKKVLMLFLLAGILVNVFSPYARSLGASGAVYAILGALIVLRPQMIIYVYWLPMPMFLAGIFWFLQDIFGVFYPTGVANLSHVGGLLIGLTAGLTWRKQFADKSPKKTEQKDPILEKQLDEWERQNMLRK
jgi:uncharacterized protein